MLKDWVGVAGWMGDGGEAAGRKISRAIGWVFFAF